LRYPDALPSHFGAEEGVAHEDERGEDPDTSEAKKWRHLTVSTVFEDGRFDSRLYMANSGINS
jgi:hypothetical protein